MSGDVGILLVLPIVLGPMIVMFNRALAKYVVELFDIVIGRLNNRVLITLFFLLMTGFVMTINCFIAIMLWMPRLFGYVMDFIYKMF